MGTFLSNLFQKFGGGAAFDAPLAPDQPFMVIGDIHGQLEALDATLDRIAKDPAHAELPLVFVGDYMDRGPHSAGVLNRLMGLQASDPRDITCLRGNHEQLLLNFLDNPPMNAPVWFANGGLATLNSFGIRATKLDMRGERVLMVRERLKMELGGRGFIFPAGAAHRLADRECRCGACGGRPCHADRQPRRGCADLGACRFQNAAAR